MPTLKFVPRTPLARDEDGSINEARTTANFVAILAATVAGHVAPEADEVDPEETAQLAGAVERIFDASPGAYITKPVLASLVVTEMNGQRENWSSLNAKALAYITSASQGDDSLLVVKRGPGFGVARRADLPVPAVEAPVAPTSEPTVEA